MQHNLCECGHDKRIHGHFGQPCLGCDCPRFVQIKAHRDRKPRLSKMLRRMARKFDMNQ